MAIRPVDERAQHLRLVSPFTQSIAAAERMRSQGRGVALTRAGTYVVQVPLTTCTYSITSPVSLITTTNGVKVWLDDSQEVGSASACCSGLIAPVQPLTLQPQVFVTGVNAAPGTVEINYMVPDLIPSEGVDLLCAANASANATVGGDVPIQYASLGSLLAFLPLPSGTLAQRPGCRCSSKM
jgi:hypothetical protein